MFTNHNRTAYVSDIKSFFVNLWSCQDILIKMRRRFLSLCILCETDTRKINESFKLQLDNFFSSFFFLFYYH